MKEIWKDIEGYEGLYQVSNLGRIKNFKNQIHAVSVDKYGYLQVTLYYKEKPRCFRVHRLVAKAFIPNSENKLTVNHIDGNKKNNKVDNLEWNTIQENSRHAWKMGLRKNVSKAVANANRKRTKVIEQYDLNNNFIKEWESIISAAMYYGVCSATISACINNKQKTSCGYIWKLKK